MNCPCIEQYGNDYVKLYLEYDRKAVVIPMGELNELYEAIYQFNNGGELNSHGWNGMLVQDMDILGKFGCPATCLFDDAERKYKRTGKTTEVWQCIKVYGEDKTLEAPDEEEEAEEVEEDCCCCQADSKQTGLGDFL